MQSCSSAELPTNELVKEFAERARTANNAIQSYMNSENPQPDSDTMLTLIETNDQLNIAMSKHQRALLQARKSLGLGTPSPQPQADPMQNAVYPPQQNAPHLYAPPQQNAPHLYAPPSQGQFVYSQSPSRQQNPMSNSYNNSHYDEMSHPASGAPPPQQNATTTQAYGYSSSPPPAPARAEAASQNVSSPTQSHAYGVAENPFTDDAGYSEPQQKSYTLFDRPANTPSPGPAASEQQRPGPYNASYQPTPSYLNRQESSSAHITMSGASPPQTQQTPTLEHGRSPLNSGDETDGVSRRMDNMRI